jgi:hypothetical protein
MTGKLLRELDIKGAWGWHGNTNIYPPAMKIETARYALTAAWRNAPNRLLKNR